MQDSQDEKYWKTPIAGVIDFHQITRLNALIMKVLHCSDAGFDCTAVVRDTSEEAVMEKAARHAQEAHGATLTPESEMEIRSMIREE